MEYILLELEHGDGVASLEAFPDAQNLGNLFFRWHGRGAYAPQTAAVKHSDETWDAFWGRLDPDWALIPLMRELTAELFDKHPQAR